MNKVIISAFYRRGNPQSTMTLFCDSEPQLLNFWEDTSYSIILLQTKALFCACSLPPIKPSDRYANIWSCQIRVLIENKESQIAVWKEVRESFLEQPEHTRGALNASRHHGRQGKLFILKIKRTPRAHSNSRTCWQATTVSDQAFFKSKPAWIKSSQPLHASYISIYHASVFCLRLRT